MSVLECACILAAHTFSTSHILPQHIRFVQSVPCARALLISTTLPLLCVSSDDKMMRDLMRDDHHDSFLRDLLRITGKSKMFVCECAMHVCSCCYVKCYIVWRSRTMLAVEPCTSLNTLQYAQLSSGSSLREF